MFTQNVQQLFKMFNCTNTEIAHYAGCNPSHISRMRTGARIPSANDRSIIRLIEGFYGYADNHNFLYQLAEICGCDNAKNPDEIKTALCTWLYKDNDTEPKPIAVARPKKKSALLFGEKFDKLMDIADLSNVRLGKIVNIDASQISRFRNGVRLPKQNHRLSVLMCKVLLERATEQGKLHDVCEFSGIAADADNGLPFDEFCDWLFNNERNDSGIIDNLLDKLDSFFPNMNVSFSDLMMNDTREILSDSRSLYRGTDGLRKAVIRLLASSAKAGGGELWLYSDQSMDWLTGDPEYRLKWYALMSECVKSGVKIKIIHNVDRDVGEMVTAVESWLPLYMSGMIESFYSRQKNDGRFSHTLFLRPSYGCIQACNIIGSEENGIYHFYSDSEILSELEAEYSLLLAKSEPLLKIYTEHGKNDYVEFIESDNESSEITELLLTLSVETMPEELLTGMLEKRNITGDKLKQALKYYHTRKKAAKAALQNGFLYEFAPLPSDEMLFAGKVRVNLDYSLFPEPIYYADDEFAVHIAAIINLMEEHTNYRFYVLPETAYNGIQLALYKESAVAIRSVSPYAAFSFSNHDIMKAFSAYFESLKYRYKQDRIITRQKLSRYL